MKIVPHADDIARMNAVASLHGHNDEPYELRTTFPLPDHLAAIVRKALDSVCRALGTRAANRVKPQ